MAGSAGGSVTGVATGRRRDEWDGQSGFSLLEVLVAVTVSAIALVAGTSAMVGMDRAVHRTEDVSSAMEDLWVVGQVLGRDVRLADSLTYTGPLLSIRRSDGVVLGYSLSRATDTAFRQSGGAGDAMVASHVVGWWFSILPFGGLRVDLQEVRGGVTDDARFIFPFSLGRGG